MRVLPLLLAALLALAGVAAAAGDGAAAGGRLSGILPIFGFGKKSRTLLQTDPSAIDATALTSGASTISLTIVQRKPATTLRYSLISYNNDTKTWPDIGDAQEVTTTPTQTDGVPSADFVTHQATLSNLAPGYYRVVVTVVMGDGGEYPFDFPTTAGLGIAVGAPGLVTINSVANVLNQDKFTVTFTQSSPVTASKYRYKVYPFGTDPSSATASADANLTPWTTATRSFTTPTALSPGLYSVWVEVQHKDVVALSQSTTTGATSYAIGKPGKPAIKQVDEPHSDDSNKFKVYFVLPNNVQEMGYTLTDLSSGADATPKSTCQSIGGSKCKAAFTAVNNGPNGATHLLVTDSAPEPALYRITLWGFNDLDKQTGTASDASAPVATYSVPGTPAAVTAVQSSTELRLNVQFTRATFKVASGYYYTVKDAGGNAVEGLIDQKASIDDITQDSLQFPTALIPNANQRYSVVVKACTGQGTLCSTGGSSNLAGVGQPTAPQNVHIGAGLTTLTVTWDAPATDSAATYTVNIYKDVDAFTAVAQSWVGVAWDDATVRVAGTSSYSFTTPTLTLDPGYYRAEVVAVHPQYTPAPANSDSDRAALGSPGGITITAVTQEAMYSRIRITFQEAEPKTGESYKVTLQTRATNADQPANIEGWEAPSSATTKVDGSKEILISTASDAQPSWPGAGRYYFIVQAANEGGGTAVSAASAELLVGPPGAPTATVPDTTNKQLSITLNPGTPTLDETYRVRIFKVDGTTWPLSCPDTGYAQQINSASTAVTTTALTDAQAIYCVRVAAVFRAVAYFQPIPVVPVYVGTPELPNTPTLESGVDGLTVKFDCPTIWNSRYLTYELTRVDLGRTNVVTTSAASPKLVRGSNPLAGEKAIVEDHVEGHHCSFTIPSSEIPLADDASSNIGQYRIKLKAHNDAASSQFSTESANAWLGEPTVPEGVDSGVGLEVTNSDSTDTHVTIQMKAPAADVHGGFVLKLKWLRGSAADDVASDTPADGTNLYVRRFNPDGSASASVDTSTGGVWKVSFPFNSMLCGGVKCTKGRFSVAVFGALSRFSSGGAFQPVASFKSGKQIGTSGDDTTDLPPGEIYYGHPDKPSALAIVSRRVYDPTTKKLQLQVPVPDADVASGYAYTLTYFKVQDYADNNKAVDVTGTVSWDAAVPKDVEGQKMLELSISLAVSDCEPTSANNYCGVGSYRLKSFTPVSRVSNPPDSSVDGTILTGLANGGDIIVGGDIVEGETDSQVRAPQSVQVPNLALDATDAGETVIHVQVDAPLPDSLMGWSYQLDYIPGPTGTAAAVKDSSGATTFYVSRLSAEVTDSGARLSIPLKKLGELLCNQGDNTYGSCSGIGGGKFQLKSITAYSWFDSGGHPVLETSYTSAAFAALTPANLFFYVGSPSAPTGIRVPHVELASADLKIYVAAPVADLAFSYVFTLKRIKPGGTDDTLDDLVVLQTGEYARRLVSGEFELTIPSSKVNGPGRFQLTEAKATSWLAGVDPVPASLDSNFPIYFIYGSPSESTISVVEAPNIQDGTTVNVAVTAPVADVARYYTVAVSYFSGTSDTSSPLSTASAPVVDVQADCTTTGKQALSTVGQTARAGAVLVVRCPVSCAGTTTALVHTSAADAYLYTSSICRAAIHNSKIINADGGVVKLTLQAGPTSRTWTVDETGTNSVATSGPGAVPSADNWDMTLADSTGLTATTIFTVARAAAKLQEANLQLPIDLSQAKCRTGGTPEQNKCGRGKYLVTSVKAHPWSGTGTQEDTSFKKFSFVGDPETPTGVVGVSTTAAENTLSIRFTRTDIDTATAYYVEATEYFPGSTEKSPKCTGTINMPDDSDDVTSQFYTDVDATTRQIKLSCTSFNPAKYKVTTFKAVSAFTTPTDDFDKAATPSTAYFYSGTVGGIEDGSVTVDNSATSPSKLAVEWQQSAPDAAATASYKLYRWRTGATAQGNNLCDPDGAADLTSADVTYKTAPTTSIIPLRMINVPLCSGAGSPLAAGRYKLEWTVVNGADASNSVMKESQFFYIGNPVAPAAPAVANLITEANGATTVKLGVTFSTPATDNAAGYKYELAIVDSPSVTEGQPGFALVAKFDVPTEDLSASGTHTFQHTLQSSDVGKLYRVRIYSWNGNNADGVASGWSDVVGTGNPAAPIITDNMVANVAQGSTTLEVKLDMPAADVALYYTIDVDYYSGQQTAATALTTTGTAADVADVLCATTGQDALATAGLTTFAPGASLVVRCPTNCAGQAGDVYNDGAYLFISSICRAAVHAGVMVDSAGGIVSLTLSAGGSLARTFTAASTEHSIQTAALSNFNTAADNWNMALAAVGSLPTTTTFTVMRWGGTNRVASVDANNKLVLPINLSQSFKCGAAGASHCGNGKYVVKQVTAFPWVNSGSYVSAGNGVSLVAARTAFTFVGDPGQPSGVYGLHADEASSTVDIKFALPEMDNAQSYEVVITKYFPGRTDAGTCTGTFTMPDSAPGTKADLVDVVEATAGDSTRKITFRNLKPTASCSSLSGKFRVTSLTAITAAYEGVNSVLTQPTFTTASLFYIGKVGDISQVAPTNQATSPATSLTVKWQQADPDPAKSASYSLWRYRTGQTQDTREAICTDTNSVTIDVDRMNALTIGVTKVDSDLQLKDLDLCHDVKLESGRYLIDWTVQGNPSGNTKTATSSFFYIGNPDAPAVAPAVVNDATGSKLKVTFNTPATDNAETYTYDLVKLDNPSVEPPTDISSPAGYTVKAADHALPEQGTTLGAANGANPTLNTFYLTGLTDGLYRVRIRSNNPNGADALSAWSDVIGTGSTPAKPSIISVQDGLGSLTVKFSLVANAIKYKYTVYKEGLSTSALTGHIGKQLATNDITWTGSTEGKFVIGPDANLVAGRYKVVVAAINTEGSGNDQTGDYSAFSNMAAVGMPSQPSKPTLAVPTDPVTGKLIKRALEITFNKPAVDSGLEYYYALYRADAGTEGECYTTVGVKVDTATNSEGFTVTLPDEPAGGSLTANPTGTTRKFRLEGINALYDYKIMVGVKNGLVVSKDSADTSVDSSQKQGGVTSITVCGGSATALDSTVYWSELSEGTTSAIDDPDAPSDVMAVYNHATNNLAVTFKAPATARSYTYKVVDVTRSNSEQVAMTTAATISPTQLAGDIITVPGGITTAAWPPGRYKVIVYVQSGFATGEASPKAASAEFYAGTPAEVSNVLLENKAGVADTIIVKYTPPAVDIAQESTAGNYRYKLYSRATDCSWSTPAWEELSKKPTCTGTAPSDVVCSFDIANLADGLYKVEVAGRMTYPKRSPATGNDEAAGTAVSSEATTEDSTFMRSGLVAVGAPGVPQVQLIGGASSMAIKITGVASGGNNNALRLRWIFKKDADTQSDSIGNLKALDIPLPVQCSYPVQYTVNLADALCGVDRNEACTAGTYSVGVRAVNGAGDSDYQLTAADYTTIMGEPNVPAGVSVANSPSTQDKVTIQMTAPTTDVHGGFVLQLKWLRGASAAVDVVSSTSADGTSLYVSRLNSDGSANTNVDTSTSGVWKISFPFAEMVCDTGEPLEDACTKGRFGVAAFGALSRFSSDGTLQPVTSFKSGKQIGTSAPLTSLPGGDIYYGNPDQPSGLTIANSPLRIYNPSAVNTLNLQFSVPAADVAKEYAYELDYIPVQGVATTKTLSGKVDWSTVQTTSTGTALYTVKIDLTQLDCDLNTDLTQTCGTSIAGSYKLKSFKAITRVASGSGGQDSTEASLTNAGGVIFVEQQNGVPAPPTGVYVPNVQTPGSTEITFELDVPAVDNIMGWEYELDFIPGTTGLAGATAVQDNKAIPVTTTFYVPRLSASPGGERLQFTKALADLNCKVGTGAYAPCTGGKFQLKNLKALSWFTATTPSGITAEDADSRATVAKSDGTFTRQSVQFGSPLSEAAAQWDAVFYVGSPAAPTGIRVVDVAMAASDLQIYLAAPVDDLAYAYTFTLQRVWADGTADTAKTVTVHQNKRALQQPEFVLTIDTGSLNGAGRYQLTAAAAKSWFDTDVAASLDAPIVFIYGSPSETAVPVISAVPNEPTGTTLHVAINPPAADVARYYTVAVDYHSGKEVSRALLTPIMAVVDFVASCSTTAKEVLTALERTAQKEASLVVRCPTSACAGQSGAVYNDGAYLFTSSICRAAVHGGVIGDSSGGTVTLTLSQGAALPRTFAAAPAETAGASGVALDALAGFNTAADNWDMALTSATSLPTTTTFTVMRWGSAARDASIQTIDGAKQLVLPIDLTQGTNCGTGANQCGNGKYVVKSVTAHPWSGTSNFKTSTPDRTASTFVGTPDAPAGIRVPNVVLATSPLDVFIAAPAEDLAQSYAVTLERLPAGTADGSGTPISIEVARTAVTLVDTDGNPEYQLAIPASDLQTTLGAGVAVAGRYRLYELKAVSWFDTQQAPSRTPATFTPIHFVIGSPSDSSVSVEVSAADNKPSGTVLDVAIPSPDVDIAKYYLVQVSYFIGDAETVLQTNTFSCATTAKGTFAGQTPAAGTSLVVNCPGNCAGAASKVYTSAAGAYLFKSSVCRAAIHAGVISNSGGPVQLALKAGSGTSRTWIQSTNLDVQSETGSDTLATSDDWDMTLQALTPAPTTTSFIVPRWGGSAGLVANVQGSGAGAKLVLPVDLSQAVCRTENSNPVPCGDGKYLVKSVTAMPWHDSSEYTPPATGAKASSAHTLFTFIGNPEQPQNVVGVGSTELNKLSISFTLPKADMAQKYTVQAQKFFPGNQLAETCGADILLPSNAGDTLPVSVVDSGGQRTIKITCTHTPGKFKVVQLKAVSRQSGGTDKNADLTTAAYFYVGTVGTITSVSSPSIPNVVAGTPSTFDSLEVLWRQTSPDPAKTASYTLYSWPTGASAGTDPCTVNLIESQMNAVVYQDSDSSKPLRLPSAPLCGSVTALAKGRYTIEWTVQGWTAAGADPATNQATLASDFFYIGNPEAPGTPTLANDAANSKLKVTFDTPTVDTAAGYKYDLVKLANPSVAVPAGTNSGGSLATDGFMFVAEKSDVPTAGLGATSSTFEHELAVADASALYRVRVWSYNANDETGVASGWSTVIGTGNIAGTSPSSVTVVDEEDKLTVTFKLVAGALGYEYTVYPGKDQGSGVTGHTDAAVTVGSWSIADNTATFDIAADANIQKGRYMVAVRPTNYKLVNGASTLTVGSYAYSAVAAVGTPGEPSVTVLTNPTVSGALVKKSIQVTVGTPSPDSALEYYYVLVRDDTAAGCYVSTGQAVPSASTTAVTLVSGDLVWAATKTFTVNNLDGGDYKVRVGVKNGLTTSAAAVDVTLCDSTQDKLSTNVLWGPLSTAIVSVDNPGKPGQPTVVYDHGNHLLTVTFDAPAMTRFYTYKVTKSGGGTHVAAGTETKPFSATNPGKPETFTIDTKDWGPDRYQVTVYVQNAYTTAPGDASDPSTEVYVGTPAQVSEVLLANKEGAADTITVKYTPPIGLDIAGEVDSTGSYRYTVRKRDIDSNKDFVFADLTSKVDQDAAKPTCSGTPKVCSFDIGGLTAGMYQVKVWGRMTYPKPSPATGDDVATGTPVSSSGDHSTCMRSGQVALGAPGVPTVTLAGAEHSMTITITGIKDSGNENVLSYQWVFLKDGDTATDATGLTGIGIPIASVDPLAAPLSKGSVTYTVDLSEDYPAGTYRVGVKAVNGAGTSAYQLTTVDRATSIMGLPSIPEVTSFVVKDNTMDELVVTWNMPNVWTANPLATPSYTYTITNVLEGSTDTYTGDLTAPGASEAAQTFTRTVTPTIAGSGLYKVEITARNRNGHSSNAAFPPTGLVVGLPIAGGTYGLRGVSAGRKVDVGNPSTKELSINFKDGLNSWFGEANCETTYEWELVRWPGLELVASSSQTISPCGNSACTGSGLDRGCSGIVADIATLADGRYQVFVLAFNKYGYTRSEGSNAFTVGAPSANPLSITARDGDSKITVSFATPERPGSYQCQGTGADNSDWSPATVTKQLSEVSLSSDGQTTSFDITSTDVGALATTKQRWAVQCKPINDWTTAVGYSAPAYAASGAPVPAGAPTLALAASAVTFNFAPASPDAAITYVFILEDQDGNVHESSPVGFASLAPGAGADAGKKVYTWANAPSGQFKGKVRSVNGVGSATSPESAELVVGTPGTPGKPTALSGQTGFVVTFSPGTPSAATFFKYTIYTAAGTPVVGGAELLADPSTATGATAPSTPTGGTDYKGLTASDRLSFNTGNLAAMTGLALAAGVYKIAVLACNDKLPAASQCSSPSPMSDVVSRGSPGIPKNLVLSTGSLNKLKLAFDVPSPNAASYYEYTVRDASNLALVGTAIRKRVELQELDTSGSGKLSFETVALDAYKRYDLRLTAVGYGSVYSSWSTPSAVAGMLGAPTAVSLAPGADSLTVTFTADALLLNTDTFAYKIYALGDTSTPAGSANGYLVPRASITNGDLAAAGQKSFTIALGATIGQLSAPAGGYNVEVMAARPLASGGFEAGALSSQAGPATLGAPSALAAAPRIMAVTSGGSPKVTVEWDYADQYSTYTKVDWQIKDGATVAASGSVNRAGAITAAVSSPLSIDIPLNTGGANKDQSLAGRFTIELSMANAQANSAWSAASAIFAAGTPTAPATVTIAGGTSSMTGTFTLPATPVYDTLAYRLVSVGQDGTGTSLLFGDNSWKELSSAEIDAKTFTITDPVVVGGTSYPVPTGRYRLDMRAAANNGATPADYIGSTASQTPAYKGVPAAVVTVSATSQRDGDNFYINIAFPGVEFATGYKVHVLDSSGAAVMSGDTAVVTVLPDTIKGSGAHSYSLQSGELGGPTGAATFKFKVESTNPNTGSGTGALSPESILAIFGKLVTPTKPALVWVDQAGSDPAHAELRFTAITVPAGASPSYEYQLYDATQQAVTAVGTWQAIDLAQATLDGSTYKLRLAPSPGKYTVTMRANTALGASARSDESEHSAAEVTGVTSEPSFATIVPGTDIDTAGDGATTVTLHVTLPSSNIGTDQPQLQLRMDTVEPTEVTGVIWADVVASCNADPAGPCIAAGDGTSGSPHQVRVKLTAAPRRVKFVARTSNDNGAGAESGPSNTISVGRPIAPAVTATGSASGVEVSFTPDAASLLTTDTFRYWAVGSDGTTERLAEAAVGAVTVGAGGKRTFSVPLSAFGGTYIVTLKIVAVNANGVRSADAAASSVTVGPVNKPTQVTATPAVTSGSATVAVEWLPGDATATKYDIKAYSEKDAVMTFGTTGAVVNGDKLRKELSVGGGVGQLPPGLWKFAVVAENANSQAMSDQTAVAVPAGVPGAPVVMAVSATPNSNDAAITFTLAGDNLAEQVRASYAPAGADTWTELPAAAIPENRQITLTSLPTGIWRFRLEAGNTVAGAWSTASNVWPAVTVGLPGKPTIHSATGSKDTITLVVEQAADATATSFELAVFNASGAGVTPTYNAPLLSVGSRSNGRQTVVFATDNTKLGGTYRFKVTAVSSVGKSLASDMTDTAVAAYQPAAPTGLSAIGGANKATLTFTPPAGAVWYEATIQAAGSWQVPTATSLALYAPCPLSAPISGCTALSLGSGTVAFDVPLAALGNRDGDYAFKVRAVDANSVAGDWSSASSAVTVGAPDAPTALAATAEFNTNTVDLSFVPAWLAEQGYEIEVLDKDGNAVKDANNNPVTLTVSASTCTAKPAAPQ